MDAGPIHVDYEYGNLKDVIVGRADMRYPDLGRADWAAEALKVLPDSEAGKIRERSGMHSRELPKHELMEAENDALIALLVSFGVVVRRPDPLTDELVAANYGAEWLVNITVHRVAFGNHTEDGGSLRCSTHPLVRRLGAGFDG